MTGTELDWATDVLDGLGILPTLGALQALVAVAAEEGTAAADNPDDTTQPEPGATTYNWVGVRNYPSWDVGVAATVTTLRNGDYGPVLAALAGGDPAAIVEAWARSPWGTWEGDPNAALATLADVQAHWAMYASRSVPGTAPTTTPATPANTPLEYDMPSAVWDPTAAKIRVFARDPNSHLLEFSPDPADPSGWSVTDVTDALLQAYPHSGPYEVAS